MDPFRWFRSLFSIQRGSPAHIGSTSTTNGCNEFEAGKLHYQRRQWAEALQLLNLAADCGHPLADICEMRAISLQKLKREDEAIQEFSRAIELKPFDCNLFFLRGLSRTATRDYSAAIEDFEVAIDHSVQYPNQAYDRYARELGFSNVGDMYRVHLERAQRRLVRQPKMQG